MRNGLLGKLFPLLVFITIKLKSMEKDQSRATILMSRELTSITYISFGALQLNKDFPQLLLLRRISWYPGFIHWLLPSPRMRRRKKFRDFFWNTQYLPNVFQCFILGNLYCAIMLGFHRSGHICVITKIVIHPCYWVAPRDNKNKCWSSNKHLSRLNIRSKFVFSKELNAQDFTWRFMVILCSSVLQKFVVTYAKQVVVVLSLIKPSRYKYRHCCQ